MRILDWNSLGESGRRAALARPNALSREEVSRTVHDLIAQVRLDGDRALRELTLRLDGAGQDDRFEALKDHLDSSGSDRTTTKSKSI